MQTVINAAKRNKPLEKVRETIKIYTDKRFSTIAGTLVYFLLMSIAPFILWLTLVFGNINMERFLSFKFFESIAPFLRYLKQSAESAASGAGVVLLLTSLYSSTNFFYHLRRSGEIIYESESVKGGLKLRLASLVLIAVAITLVAATAAITVLGAEFLNRFLPEIVSEMLACVVVTALAFASAVTLNLFACPYKQKLSDVMQGSLLTTALWLIFVIGFGIYAVYARPERLYGKIAAVIIFLLWCYVMMSCFVIGMITNCPRDMRRFSGRIPSKFSPMLSKTKQKM